MRRSIPTVLIITGLLLISYPTARDIYFSYQQQKLIADWQESMLNIEMQLNEDNTAVSELTGESEPIRKKETRPEARSQTANTAQADLDQQKEKEAQERKRLEQEKAQRRAEYIKSNMEGILEIAKINLEVPILSEATKKNLDISVSSIINTGKAGQIGNYCIAGHNSKYYGKNFNRLDEVEIGDNIKVNDGTSEYQYIVYDKLLVKPQEIWVLKGNETHREITLITCDKIYNSTQRLIIKGRMED